MLDGLHSVFVAFVCIPSYNLEEEGETLEQAAVREVKEEINCDLDASKLDMLCSHYMKDGDFEQHTHLMVCQVTAESLYAILKR